MNDTDFDVIVVGVGGMGSATVSHLARRGVDALGIERFDIPNAKGSSHGVTRIIRLPQYEGADYVPLVRRALDLWKDLDDGYDRPLFHQVGSLDFGTPDSEVYQGARESSEAHDIPHEVLSGTEIGQRFPGYDVPEEYRGVYQPDGGFLHSEQAIVAHVEDAHAHGATVRARERVEEWDADEWGVTVRTDRGEYAAEKLVVTAGAWNGQLLPSLADYLEPERQVLSWFQPRRPDRFQPDQFPVFVADVPEGHYYGFPVHEVPGLKIGLFHHREETGTPEELDREPTREDERVLREFGETYFPEGTGPTMRLAPCMFTNTPDGDFIVDTHPNHENVVVGAGFSGHGFKFTSVLGEMFADLALDGATDRPTSLFSVDRFD